MADRNHKSVAGSEVETVSGAGLFCLAEPEVN